MIPKCKKHGEMTKTEITQGTHSLGFVWFCKEEECDECEDYTPALDEVIREYVADGGAESVARKAKKELAFHKEAMKQLYFKI